MYSELDNLVQKFKHVETHACQALVHLHVQLGQAHGLPQQHYFAPEFPLKTLKHENNIIGESDKSAEDHKQSHIKTPDKHTEGVTYNIDAEQTNSNDF